MIDESIFLAKIQDDRREVNKHALAQHFQYNRIELGAEDMFDHPILVDVPNT